MRPLTVGRLALAGSRSDTFRVTLTGVAAALGTLSVLAAGTVLSITIGHPDADGAAGFDYRYTNDLLNEPGLRPGVSFALVLLTIPVLLFAAQCTRIGAPARDRRLAAFRMVGATPGQVRLIAAVETGVAALVGAALGVAAFLGGRVLLDTPGPDGRRPLPTDVMPPSWLFGAVVVGLPVVATLLAMWLLRRVAVTPFGVVRRERPRRPRPWPGVLIAVGLAGLGSLVATSQWMRARIPDEAMPPIDDATLQLWLYASVACLTVGILLGGAWLGHRMALLLGRRAGRPSLLIATRRLVADPWSGSRTLALVLVATVVAVGVALLRAWLVTYYRARDIAGERQRQALGEPPSEFDDPFYGFYIRAFELVDNAVTVAAVIAAAGLALLVAEGIVTRRRTLASLVAAGTPRGVLARATLLQVLIPLVSGVALVLGVGWLAALLFVREASFVSGVIMVCERSFGGDGPPAVDDPAYRAAGCRSAPETTVALDVPVPWQDFVIIGGGAIAVVTAVTAISLLFLRTSTDVSELRTG